MNGTRPAHQYTYAVTIPAHVTMGPDGKVVRIDLRAGEILSEIPQTDDVTINVDAETREADRAALEEYLEDHVQTVWDNPAALLRVELREGVVRPLTPCCDDIGSETDTGAVCRTCHAEIEPLFGEGAEPWVAVDRIGEWLQDIAPGLSRDAADRHARDMWRDALISYATAQGLDLRPDALAWYGQWGWLIDNTRAWDWIRARLTR